MEVELPDGTIAEFPDDMAPEAVKAVLAKKFPKPTMGPFEKAGRQAALGGRAVLKGLSYIPAAIGDAANAVTNQGIRGLNAVAGTDISPIPSFTQGVDAALSGTKPETAPERIAAQPVELLASIPAGGAIGKAASKYAPQAFAGLEKLAEGYGPQAAMAFLGGLGYGGSKEVTDNPVAQAAALLVPGGGAALYASKMSQNASKAAIPAAEQLKEWGRAAYKASEDAGVIIKPERIQALSKELKTDLAELGIDATLHPRSMAALARLDEAGAENITLKGLDTLRKVARNAAQSTDKSDSTMASQIIKKIDKTVASLTADDIVQGSREEAVNALLRARSFWHKSTKAEIIDDAIDRAIGRAATSGTGGNQENAIRQNFERILRNKKLSGAFNKEELAAIKNVARGSNLQNALRQIGKMSPRTGGLSQMFALGGTAADLTMGAPLMTGAMGLGTLAKIGADKLNRNAANSVSEVIRARAAGMEIPGLQPGLMGARALPGGVQNLLPQGLMGQGLPAGLATGNGQPGKTPRRLPR